MPTREVDIWADESAAATVRELADGNETVPTVMIGGRGYVYPPAATVLAEMRRISPGSPDQNLARIGRRRRCRRFHPDGRSSPGALTLPAGRVALHDEELDGLHDIVDAGRAAGIELSAAM